MSLYLRLRKLSGSHIHLDKNNFKVLCRARTQYIDSGIYCQKHLANMDHEFMLTLKKISMFKR
jgi:hypothetical protein